MTILVVVLVAVIIGLLVYIATLKKTVGSAPTSPLPSPPPPQQPISEQHAPIHTLSVDQKFVLEQMENTTESMFVTGGAGTGKSFLLKQFVENTKKPNVVVVAPTGAAAINVGGQTIHSFFQLAPAVQFPDNAQVTGGTNLWNRLRRLGVLIIDEVSMVRVDVLSMIDKMLRIANENEQPFGGKQVIMFGDPFQLPPIVADNDGQRGQFGQPGQLQRYFDDTYGGAFFFFSPCYKQAAIKTYVLNKTFRQSDEVFIDILNRIRVGKTTVADLEILNGKCQRIPESTLSYFTLVPTNAAAANINKVELAKIPSNSHFYDAIIKGKFSKSDYPTDPRLELKVGALVVMLAKDKAWVNGTMGVIDYLSNNFVKVKINDVVHSINKKVWEKKEYYYDAQSKTLEQKVVASFEQYPVKLAWALTIHKAQGQTYDAVAIDLGGGAFAAGQSYVALSRCKSMDTLYLIRDIKSKDITVDQDVVAFMEKGTVSAPSDVDNPTTHVALNAAG